MLHHYALMVYRGLMDMAQKSNVFDCDRIYFEFAVQLWNQSTSGHFIVNFAR